MRLPKTGTSACRDFFLSWGEINVFFHLILDMVAHIEGEADRHFDVLLGGASDDDEYERLLRERESWQGPAALLGEREQFLFQVVLVRHIENYLNYLSGLLFDIFTQRPETLKSSEMVTLEEVLSYDSMDDLTRAIAQRRVNSLSYKSFDHLVEYFALQFGLVVFAQPQLASVAEAVETRNISVHNRCIVNERYVKKTGVAPSLIGSRRNLSMEQLDTLVPMLADGVRRLDGQARRKFKLRGVRFDIERLLGATTS